MIELRILERLGLYRPLDYDYARFDRLAGLLDSPIEKAFWSVAYFELSKHGELTPQAKVGPYRVDFLYRAETGQYVIELDGQDYHSSPAQRAADYERERVLQTAGYTVIRFTGSEIYRDAQQCVMDALRIVGAK